MKVEFYTYEYELMLRPFSILSIVCNSKHKHFGLLLSGNETSFTVNDEAKYRGKEYTLNSHYTEGTTAALDTHRSS